MIRRKEEYSLRQAALGGLVVLGFLGLFGCEATPTRTDFVTATAVSRNRTVATATFVPATSKIVLPRTPEFTDKHSLSTIQTQVAESLKRSTKTPAPTEACQPDVVVAFAGTSTFGNMNRLRNALGTTAIFPCLVPGNLQIIGDYGAKTTAVISDMQERKGFLSARTSHFFTYVGYNNLKLGLEQRRSVDQVVAEAKDELAGEMDFVKSRTAARRFAILIVPPPTASDDLKLAISLYDGAIINEKETLGVHEVVDIRTIVSGYDWEGEHMNDCVIENVLAAQINLILNPGRQVQVLPCSQKTPAP